MIIRSLMLLVLLAIAAVAGASVQVERRSDSMLDILTRVEKRLRGLEESWINADLRMKQGALKLETLSSKIDRIEKSLGNRMLFAQRASERTSSTCLKLNDSFLLARRAAPDEAGTKNDPKLVVEAIGKEATAIETKMTGLYNDLWRRSLALEGLLKESLNASESARRESREGFRSLAQSRRQSSSFQNMNSESTVDNFGKTLHRKLTEVDAKLSAKLQNISFAQENFRNSCQRIQLHEEQMETNIVRVLDGLMITLGTIMNRTVSANGGVQKLHELIDSHGSQIMKAVKRGNNATALLRDEHKAFAAAMAEERRQAPNNRKFDNLLTLLQELREEFAETPRDSLAASLRDEVVGAIRESLARARDDERDSLVEKLTAAVERLQDLIVRVEDDAELDDAARFFDESTTTDEHNDESDAVEEGSPPPPVRVLSPDELIDRLNNIRLEKSPEEGGSEDEYDYNEKHGRKHAKFSDGGGPSTKEHRRRAKGAAARRHPNERKYSLYSRDDEAVELDEDYDENYIQIPMN